MLNKLKAEVKSSPKWHLVYYVLAAFDIVAISFSIYLNHMIMNEFAGTIDVNHQWSERLSAYTGLGTLATRLNSPGNDVFNSGDIALESERMESYLRQLQTKLNSARDQVTKQHRLRTPEGIPLALSSFEQSITLLAQQARLVFRSLDQGNSTAAGEHMATMDNHFSQAFSHIAQLQTLANQEQTALLKASKKKADRFQSYEVFVAFCIAFMVIAVTIYGHLLAQRLRRDQIEKQALLDETIRKEALIEEQLEQLSTVSKAKDQFLANISHELRTPMGGILGASDLLSELLTTDKQREYTQVISNSANSLMHLINDLLDISKMESGMLDLECGPFSLKSLLQEVEELMRHKTSVKSLALLLEIDKIEHDYFYGDVHRLRQILINLAGNSIKFTEQGAITLEAESRTIDEQTSRLQLRVKDTGIGIEADKLASIFERFSQADNTITRRFGGTGLGLSISKQLTFLMNGEITAESIVGQGSVFTLDLTLEHSQAEDLHQSAVRNSLERNYAKTVLLAEDNKVNQMVISAQVKKLGITLDIVDDGLQAIEKVQENTYDLILMDMQMPSMDGVSATKVIRRMDNQQKDIPIIALTANAMERDKHECIEAGMTGFVTKPIEITRLIEELDQCFLEPTKA